MLGVITRTEAIKQYPDYANAVLMEQLGYRLGCFRDVFSTIFPHNHVVDAYHETGLVALMPDEVTDLKPRRIRYWGHLAKGFGHTFAMPVPAMVPKAVAQLLDPERVQEHFLGQVSRFTEVLEEARPILDRESWLSTDAGGDRKNPYPNVYSSVKTEECATDYVREGNSMVRKVGQGHGWKYTYNSYQHVRRMLSEFQEAILDACRLNNTAIEKIVAMMKAAKSFEQSDNYRLAESALRIDRGTWPSSLERQEGHPVNELYQTHKQIAERSDLYTRFDDDNMEVSTPDRYGQGRGHLILKTAGVFGESGRFSCTSLWHRASIRFLLGQLLEEKGTIVLNGVEYKQGNVPMAGEPIDGFHSDGPSFLGFANLLGKPVLQPDGQVINPEPWAETEVRLVEAYYRDDEGVADQLIQLYNCNLTAGKPTRKKELEQLAYSLNVDRF